MKSHVIRPFLVVLGVIVLILIARKVMVPADFGSQERGYMYGFHRKSNEAEWKAVKPKYQGREYCKDCHETQYSSIMHSPHKNINCENCHGPALTHPDNPAKLSIDRSRALCLRCHAKLPYPGSGRINIKGIDPDTHNKEAECAGCHNPHDPKAGLQ